MGSFDLLADAEDKMAKWGTEVRNSGLRKAEAPENVIKKILAR